MQNLQKLLDLKFVAAVLVLAAWFALVLTGRADATPFIDALKDILLALFGYHAVTNLQPSSTSSAAGVAQVAAAVGAVAAAEVAQDVSTAAASISAPITEAPAQ